MVEQTRRLSRAVSIQAGPGEVHTGTLFDVNLRINDRAAREFGRQLAAVGDQLDREWATRPPYRLQAAFHLLGPARTLTRTIYRDLHIQLWGVQGLSAAVKAWIANAAAGLSLLRTEAFTTWVCGLKPDSCSGWIRGSLVALVATVSVLGALWSEWKA